jgi:GntR family transcriptional regulator, sialic acid-inducible nan operon repressor
MIGSDENAVAARAGRVSDQLGERLAAMILGGELASGARLPPERELMHRFHVSRTTVREAISGLASRGLVLTRPGYRPIVRQPSYETAIDALGQLVGHLMSGADGARMLFDSRIFVEAALARFAATHARREDITLLRQALEANGAAIGDPQAFYETDVAFHGLLYRIPGNPIYTAVHKAYVEWLMRHWARMRRGEEVDRLNHAGHAAIFEAIVERDPDEAEAALRRHLAIAWELVRGTFGPPAQVAAAADASGVTSSRRPPGAPPAGG